MVSTPDLPDLPRVVRFGREVCGDLAAAEAREWLVTNGLGGYACGTIAGTLTRRYHSLLMAALPPPWNRTLLVSKVDEIVDYAGQRYSLGANRWSDGAIDPTGYQYLESFELEGTTPVWTYASADALLEKRVWMELGENTTYVQYTLARGAQPLKLNGKVMVNWRGFHNLTHASGLQIDVQPVEGGLRVQAQPQAPPFFLRSAGAEIDPEHTWYRNYELAEETARGLDHQEDHLHAATFHATLQPGDSITLVLSTSSDSSLDGPAAGQAQATASRELLQLSQRTNAAMEKAPAWIQQLTLAADEFVIARPVAERSDGASIIAGYPWFGEWGRDTMIALPGLLLATGRTTVAGNILREYARYVNQGMLPNQLPVGKEMVEYNTVDAALWFSEAARQYYATTGDLALIGEIFRVLDEIVNSYIRGTRYNIHVDSRDGLVYAGETGTQLTWMDAKIGDWVVTPRIGKPVEVNALWINALATQGKFAEALGKSKAQYSELAEAARQGFQRFWNSNANFCFDVIDGPEGDDASLRPNQIFAVALEESLLPPEQQRAIVDICRKELLTPYGLRSLSPRDPRYRGHYGGDARYRDSSYHQGTAWGWLIGPFIQAFLRVNGDANQALSFLAPFENHLQVRGLGTASEIFDGDPPYSPQGCFAQAWTVGEILPAWGVIWGMLANGELGCTKTDPGKS
jgi:predicted glycogen debranching enzyme